MEEIRLSLGEAWRGMVLLMVDLRFGENPSLSRWGMAWNDPPRVVWEMPSSMFVRKRLGRAASFARYLVPAPKLMMVAIDLIAAFCIIYSYSAASPKNYLMW